ncbi:MAG TPA: hypothetical protein VFN13_03725, partial [Rudaea sp.]|nr:hypothetical protein [Rudaea sp.]
MKYATCMLALVALVLGGCGNLNPPSGGDNTAKMELRVYQVPPEHTQDLKHALQTNFQAGSDSKTPIGSVSSPAPGQLLVLAPSSLQDSIASSLKSLSGTANSTTPATPPMQIRLQFWSVDAIAGAGVDGAELGGLSEALAQTRKSLGVVHFVLRDHV